MTSVDSVGDDAAAPRKGRAHRIKQSAAAGWAARAGMASRALIYGLLAFIVLRVAFGSKSGVGSDVDQDSSLQLLGDSIAGKVVLWALAGAVVCYFAWRVSEAWLGSADPGGHERGARVQAAIEGVAYLPFGWIAIAVATGDSRSAQQGQNYRGLAASVIRTIPGRILVIVVGLVVVGVGVFFFVQGVRRTFRGHFDWDEMAPWARRLTEISGALGSVGRGLIFVLAGVLVVIGAATLDPAKAGGVDSALDTLADRPYGHLLLVASAVGFAAFAVFTLCEAVWRRSDADDPLGATVGA